MGGPVDVILPLCAVTDLPRLLCDHCQSFSMLPVERDYIAGVYGVNSIPGPSDGTVELRVDYPSRRWEAPQPRPVACDHGKPDGAALCPSCEERLAATLHDLPDLLADLEDALVKRTAFLERGVPEESRLHRCRHCRGSGRIGAADCTACDGEGKIMAEEESALPFNLAASRALAEITDRLGGSPSRKARELLINWKRTLRRPDLPSLAHAVTSFAERAHAIIDRPETPSYYGECPECGKDIYQERITAEEELVRCGCGYRARLAQHQAAQLDLGENNWLTLTQVVRVLCDGGEPTTRQEVEDLIYQGGPMGVLPREKQNRPRWQGGRLESHEVFVYRLGDVRTMLLAKRLQRMHTPSRRR